MIRHAFQDAPIHPKSRVENRAMKMERIIALSTIATIALLVSGAAVLAQSPANPFTAIVADSWNSIKKNVAGSAAQMPEKDYAFKPTPQVRSFGQIVGHLANEHYLICSAAKGEKNPNATDYEKTATSKADLVKALTESIAYCDGAFASMTDAKANEMTDLFGSKHKRLAVLQLNVTHDSEHYGNFVTYLRLKGQVPPSSAGGR
jgi:uncharacterized damage-inducible protein DinB